jgi:hypothetical protein
MAKVKQKPVTIPTQQVTAQAPRWKGAATPPGLRAHTLSKIPCPTARKACPIQLVFRDGKPNLRLCLAQKKPGPLVPVDNPRDALARSQQLCACWEKEGKSFEKCGISQYSLGDAPRSRKRSRK